MLKNVLDKADKTQPGDYIYFPLFSLLTFSFSHFEPFITAKGTFFFSEGSRFTVYMYYNVPPEFWERTDNMGQLFSVHEKLWGMQG